MGNRFSFLRFSAIPLFILFAFSGCSMYQNVTAYFNTYYNAKKLFSDAEQEVRQAPQKDRDTNYFAAYNVPPSLEGKFDKIVEKCSKLIQFYPESKWVDDAILMIAKSDVYLGDYESSVRKCRELELLEAKAHYLMKKDDEALKMTKDFIPELRTEGKNDLLLEALMLQAQIYFDRREYDQSAQNYSLAVQVSADGSMRAFAEYQLGVSYEKLGEKAKAAEAYGGVKHFNPGYDLEYRTRLKYGIMLTETGKYDQALHTFDDLNNEQLKPEQHGLVDVEIASTYRTMGDTGVAFSLYNLIDTVYRHTEAAGKSLYIRGFYFENTLHDYKTAREYYAKAKAESQAIEYSALAQRKAASLDQYFALLENIRRYDRFLHPDTSHGRVSRSDSLSVDQPTAKSDSSAPDAGAGIVNQQEPESSPPDVANDVSRATADNGVGGGSAAYRRRHVERDLEPDDEDEGITQSSILPKGATDGKFTVRHDSVKRAPKSSPIVKTQNLSPDSVRSLMTQSYYELGTLFYLELERPDSAQRWYQKLVDEYPSSRYVSRTLYALAELHRAGGDSTTLDSLYNVILNRYGESEYATQVKKVRGLDVGERKIDVSEAQFRKGEELLQAGNTADALKEFKKVARTEQRSSFTSKAQYTVGWIYESILVQNDSAEAWYKRVMKEDSTSVYALAVAPKVRVKEKPENLKQYVKVNEVQEMVKTQKPQRRRPGGASTLDRNKNDEEVGRPGLDQQIKDDESDTKDDEEDVPDPDDDDNNNR
ncbi:MAG: tetratricopeptide repeat protein [Ignavibacteriae bacterium]|nr:tetratricopeptide repeat protein [Ignavibacteriota bacterium]